MSEEQLVRMGRTDLYRRGDTEIKDGRMVAKPGAEVVTVLTTTLGGKYPCAYQYRWGLYKVMIDGRYLDTGNALDSDLVAIDLAPNIEPWPFAEIPANHRFRHKEDALRRAYPCEVSAIADEWIKINGRWFSADDLHVVYEHSAHHCGPFEPCGKVV